jgi:uncharacterized protein (TIGR03067 family)
MSHPILLSLALAVSTVAAAPSEEQVKKETQKWDGDWKCLESEDDGRYGDGGDPMIIEDGKIKFLIRGQVTFTAKIVAVDPTANPKTIDIKYTSGPGTNGETQLGIYDWVGGKLKVCWAAKGEEKRPKKFTTKQTTGRGFQMRLFERQKD